MHKYDAKHKIKKMNKTFRLKNGEISFEEDKIKISDNAKTQKYVMLGSNLICILCVCGTIINFERLGDTSYNSFFYALIILFSIIFTITLLKSTKTIVLSDNVNSIKVKQRFENTILDIKLKNNLKRRVIGGGNAEELKHYIEENFKAN